jgi:putative NADH-flavin reductase
MKLIVFGATGMVGKQLVKQALYNGHSVKAFGRNVFTEELPKDDKLELVQGTLFDENQVLQAIKGCDAVLSALGGGFDGSDKTRSLGMKNIVAQMKKAGVHRIVGIGGMGLLNADETSLLIDQDSYPPEYLPVGREHQKAYEYLSTSGLDWTFVCPPDILNKEVTGNFFTNADYPPTTNNYKINAGDLALFMLSELGKNEFIKMRVGISN